MKWSFIINYCLIAMDFSGFKATVKSVIKNGMEKIPHGSKESSPSHDGFFFLLFSL